MDIRFKLILPAMTDDYEDQYITFAKKHSDIIATNYVIHEYQKLIENCKSIWKIIKIYRTNWVYCICSITQI